MKPQPAEELMASGVAVIGAERIEQARAAVAALGDPSPWQEARLRRIDRIVVDAGAALQRYATYGVGSIDSLQAGWSSTQWELVRIARPDWLPERPSRTMPSLERIVAYWASVDGPFPVVESEPECFRCLSTAPVWGGSYFDRAHLVDRAVGGLDHPGNIVPLCRTCHRIMPLFEIDEGQQAIDWVLDGLDADEVRVGRCAVDLVTFPQVIHG